MKSDKKATFWIKTWTVAVLAGLILFLGARVCPAGREEAETELEKGNQAFFQSDYELAEYYFSLAIEQDGLWAVGYNNRGLARYKQGELDPALVDLTGALELKEDYAGAYLNRGKCRAAQKDFSGAEADFLAGLALVPNDDRFLYNLGWVLDEQGRYAEAASRYEAALSANPDHTKARLGLAITLAKQDRTEEAETSFYQVINQAVAGDFNTQLAAYDLQLMRGDGVDFTKDQAATDFEQGIFLYSTEQYQQAAQKFMDAADLERDVPDVHWLMHWCYLRQGRTDLAAAGLNEARALMEKIAVTTSTPGALVYVDGIKKANTPGTFHLFPSKYDLFVRQDDWPDKLEFTGPIYTDGTGGGQSQISLQTGLAPDFTTFGPIQDTDRDWLADQWENDWLGALGYGPQQDETDHDSVINLWEQWSLSDPTKADTDEDGVPDADELNQYGTNPSLANTFYYVNDGSTTNDVYCTAKGDSANDGLSPASPKAGLQEILNSYDLEPGAVVLVDTGTFTLAANIAVGSQHSGSGRAPVIIRGSTRPGGTVLNRDSDEADATCLTVEAEVKYLTIQNLDFTGARAGTGLVGDDYVSTLRIDDCRSYGNRVGFCSSGALTRCIGRDNEYGLGTSTYGNPRVINSVFANNSVAGLSVTKGVFKNNIVIAAANGSHCVLYPFYISITSDYNDLYAANGAKIGRQYDTECETLACWQERTGLEAHSFSVDPLFADPDQGDFHLKSQGGRYAGGQWVADAVTSPCIDHGAPYLAHFQEPDPNGQRINLGCHGGTPYASKSPPGRALELIEIPEGGIAVSGATTIVWRTIGADWEDGGTIGIEYSSDNGTTWKPAATGLASQAGQFLWDTTRAQPNRGPNFLVRVFCEQDRSVSGQSASWFSLYNETTRYYVNDATTNSDVWCSAEGLDGPGRGADAATPAASVGFILDTYKLKPGDTVYIDTGTYNLTANIKVTAEDSGSAAAPVTFEASPYGVTINRNTKASNCYVWHLYECQYITITTSTDNTYTDRTRGQMKITGAYKGIASEFTTGCVIERLEITDNGTEGILVSKSTEMTIQNNLVSHNGTFGISLVFGADRCTVKGNTVLENSSYEINIYSVSAPKIRNNIVWADGDRDFGIWCQYTEIESCNYNLYHTVNGASVGFYNGDDKLCETFGEWQSATGFDTHGQAGDPLFVDKDGGDLHLSSTLGSYHGGLWTNDDQDSPALDAGRPGDDYSHEPTPNGDRINLGAFGNTEWASKSEATDTDGDGLIDSIEILGCTDVNDADTDDDGLLDGTEDANHNGEKDEGETDPCLADTDGDLIWDGTEMGLTTEDVGDDTNPDLFQPDLDPDTTTAPLDADTDDDGLTDGAEDANRNGRVDPGETDPSNPDTDGDGIQDGTEMGLTTEDVGDDTDLDLFQPDLDPGTTTDPLDPDTDDDGTPDGTEDPNHNGWVEPGEWDPNNPHSKPGRGLFWLQLLME